MPPEATGFVYNFREAQIQKSPQLSGLRRIFQNFSELKMVEAAGIEPASASPPPRGLHAYTVFNLAAGYPTGMENQQPV